MHDPIHRALDGELQADELTAAERAELHQYRASIGTALAPLRRFPIIDVSAEVVARLPGRGACGASSPARPSGCGRHARSRCGRRSRSRARWR